MAHQVSLDRYHSLVRVHHCEATTTLHTSNSHLRVDALRSLDVRKKYGDEVKADTMLRGVMQGMSIPI